MPAVRPGSIPYRTVGMKNLLFICSRNRLRSPTAEQVFSTWPGVQVASAGLNNDAETVLSAETVEWADIIFVMERTHRSKLQKRFGKHIRGRVVCLDIPDRFDFMDPALVRRLHDTIPRFLS